MAVVPANDRIGEMMQRSALFRSSPEHSVSVNSASRPDPDFCSIDGILRERAASTPDLVLYAYLADGETQAGSLTAADLDRRSRELAAYLQERDLAGQRVLLTYPTGVEFVVGLLGCIYAGAIAVPAYPPRNRGNA